MAPTDEKLNRIESLIRRDPARRGLLGSGGWQPGRGELPTAAEDLARRGRKVVIVTGFAVPTADGIVAETDGPPGAVILADVLSRLGTEVSLVTDETCRPAVATAMDAGGLAADGLAVCPADGEVEWCSDFLKLHSSLTHLISIERVGPNHTLESLRGQSRQEPAPIAEYESLVPEAIRDRCHNMRGEPLDAFTAPLHLLFDRLAIMAPAARSIGIGDGGNELGMGKFLWEHLHPLVPGAHGPRMVCRVPADWTIVSGTCNWGGFALAAAVALLRGRPELIAEWTMKRHEDMVEHMVRTGCAVDGVTRFREATVDGLPFITYAQACSGIRDVCRDTAP